ncbi:hypothetical protein NPIL_81721 [Nephila pilipes]|uniref:Uncharacterized protein n=1 Tax=Nephila pilipes TaxID=299642 RepID=A0A8X6U590_NEPPI|nr:hypothetical protein NPIL_81721 [Nephila pilipes]
MCLIFLIHKARVQQYLGVRLNILDVSEEVGADQKHKRRNNCSLKHWLISGRYQCWENIVLCMLFISFAYLWF